MNEGEQQFRIKGNSSEEIRWLVQLIEDCQGRKFYGSIVIDMHNGEVETVKTTQSYRFTKKPGKKG